MHNCTSLLKELTSINGIPGFEKEAAQFLKPYFEKYCDTVSIDRFFNVIGFKKGLGDNPKKLMVTSHLDEIGFLVSGIDKRGFLKVSPVGGINARVLLAQEVIVHGAKQLSGVIGAKPPHLLKDDEQKKVPKVKDFSIDVGLSAEELKDIVSIGDMVTFKNEFLELAGDRVSAKALDNRSSICSMLIAMELLSKIKHKNDIYFCATAQEEFELAGVTTAAFGIEPDAALVLDACHGDMRDAPKGFIYPLGKGPAIGWGPILSKALSNLLVDNAKRHGIPYQMDIEPDDSGTEAMAAQVSKAGILTALLSIPVRYMHTPVEVVQKTDIENTGRLVSAFLSDDEGLEGILCC